MVERRPRVRYEARDSTRTGGGGGGGGLVAGWRLDSGGQTETLHGQYLFDSWPTGFLFPGKTTRGRAS